MTDIPIIQCSQMVPRELPFAYSGDALNFKLDAGDVVSIIGPNYSGKGNWLRALCGLEDQLSGEVLIRGKNTLNLSVQDEKLSRIKVAYLHEDTALLSAANGLINVMVPAIYHQLDKNLESHELKQKALALLKQIDPEINLDELPAYLSKDHQFKIAVARALLLEPDVLALNNPFVHFNSDSKRRFQNFLDTRIKNGLSLLLVTHDTPYALSISDKIIFADRENLIYFESTQALVNCDLPIVNHFLNLPENQVRT